VNLIYAIIGGFMGGLTASIVFKKFWLTNREVEDIGIMRQVEKLKDIILPDKTRVIEWKAPQDDNEVVFNKVLEDLNGK